MQTVSSTFLAALRGPHLVDIRAEMWRAGVMVGDPLQVISGDVTNSASRTSAPRRSLTLEVVSAATTWADLSTAGTTLRAYRGVRFPDGSTERVLLGTFDIDEQSAQVGPGGGISLTCPDVWHRVDRARFETPRSHGRVNAHNQAVTYATEAIGLGSGSQTGDTAVTVRPAVWERERNEAIEELTRAAGSWIYTDTSGQVASRPVPHLSDTPVWTVDASQSGVMLSGDRTRSKQRTFNVVVVQPADTDGTAPFAPVVLADTDAASPTNVTTYGRVPFFYSSQLITTTAHATTAGQALLRRVKGFAAQLDVTSVVNPALEPGDVITVLLPVSSNGTSRVERHIVDAVNIPLTVEGTQTLRTRSSRPEGDVPAED